MNILYALQIDESKFEVVKRYYIKMLGIKTIAGIVRHLVYEKYDEITKK